MPAALGDVRAEILSPGQAGRVSCIVPAHNMVAYLGQAIDSALSQTYPDVEIVVMDDGSTDGTADFVRRNYGDRVVFLGQQRAGMAAARNRALRASTGEFVNLLDADDLWPPHRLATMVGALTAAPAWAGCVSLWRNFWDDPVLEEDDRARCAEMVGVQRERMLTAALLRRSTFQTAGLFDTRYRHSSEKDWWVRVHDSGAEFGSVEEVLFSRRIHTTNDSRGKVVGNEILQILLERHRRMRPRHS